MIEALLLGLVQGISEFLPISSSGHLMLVKKYFSSNPQSLPLILALHLGTLFSIFSYYKKALLFIIKKGLAHPLNIHGPAKPLYLLICACLPSAIGAFLLYSLVKQSVREFLGVGLGFFLTGCILLSTSWVLKRKSKEAFFVQNSLSEKQDWENFSFFKAFLIGLIQVVAFFPGFSRSGWTISLALFLAIPKKTAVFFSFLLATVAIIGGVIFETLAKDFEWDLNLAIAFISSWGFGYLALAFLVRSLNRLLFPFFAFYLWFLSLLLFFI